MRGETALRAFISGYDHLPPQGSAKWLAGRKFSIGGSEMGTIAGRNPYKNIRELIEGHLGITTFDGNINTYWGTILENMVLMILEKRWNCKIYETGSLPGSVPGQNYSPDGLVYLDFLNKTVLIEIKSAARRVANGKIPRMYKPQICTGLDTIPLADMGLFVDAMFRRCSKNHLTFDGPDAKKYDISMHPDKPVDNPISLCLIGIHEEMYSSSYDVYMTDGAVIDAGNCPLKILEHILKDAASGKLACTFAYVDDCEDESLNASNIELMYSSFYETCSSSGSVPIAIMPLKLFRMDVIPVYRDSWREVYNRKSKSWEVPDSIEERTFTQTHQETINTVISHIRRLDALPSNMQLDELDTLYPPKWAMDKNIVDDIISSLC